MKKKFDLKTNYFGFKVWEVVKIASSSQTCIIIRTKGNTCTAVPIKISKYKLVNWLRFKWIKLLVFVKYY